MIIYKLSIRVKNMRVETKVFRAATRLQEEEEGRNHPIDYIPPSSYFFLRLALLCLTFLYKRRNKVSWNEKHRLCNNIFSVSLVASGSFISYPAISASQIFISPIAKENCGSRLKFINRYRCPCLPRSNRGGVNWKFYKDTCENSPLCVLIER